MPKPKKEQKNLPYIKLWVGDYIKATMHLGTLEHGAYLLLLMHLWNAEKAPLKHCAGICKLQKKEWEKIQEDVLEFFETDGTFIWSKRLNEEKIQAQKDYETASAKGSKGAKARWEKKKEGAETTKDDSTSNGAGIAEASISHCSSNSNHSHSHTLKELSNDNPLRERAHTHENQASQIVEFEGSLFEAPDKSAFVEYCMINARPKFPQLDREDFAEVWSVWDLAQWKDTQGKSIAQNWKQKLPYRLKDHLRDRQREQKNNQPIVGAKERITHEENERRLVEALEIAQHMDQQKGLFFEAIEH